MQKILYIVLCCSHIVLATYELLPLLISAPIAVAVSFITYKYVYLDWSAAIHIALLGVYIANGPSIQNMLILLCSALIIIYSTVIHQRFLQLQSAKSEVNTQLQQFNESFQTVRKERHDYLKHVAAISYMLEKDDIVATKNYMANLIERYEETNLSIKGEQGAIAAVLHTNYKAARNAGIAINYQLDVPVSSIPLPLNELVELIGNLLENAIDASSEWQAERNAQGYVDLSLQKRSGLYILKCQNSTLPLPASIADQLFVKAGISTKESHSGLGTTIIKDIVERNHGYLDFVCEKESFSVVCKIASVV